MNDTEDGARIDAEITSAVVGSDPFAAAVRATRMPMVITDPRLPDNPIVYVNDAFVKLTGYARDEILGRNCRFLQGPETDHGDVARVRDAIERRVTIEIDLKNQRKDGTLFWNRLLVSPVFAADGELTYFFASQYDVTLEKERLVLLKKDRDALEAEAARRSLELLQSEERLRFTLKAGRLGAWTLDLGVLRLIASDGFKENLGRSPNDTLTYEEMLAAIHPEDLPRKLAARDAAIAGHSDYDVEIRVITPHGETRWLQFRGQASYRADGTPLSIAGISLDITDRSSGDTQRQARGPGVEELGAPGRQRPVADHGRRAPHRVGGHQATFAGVAAPALGLAHAVPRGYNADTTRAPATWQRGPVRTDRDKA